MGGVVTTYKKNYLKQVIARIDFDRESRWGDRMPTPVKTAAKRHFPVQEPPGFIRTQKIQFDEDGSRVTEDDRSRQWIFHTRERDSHLTIAETHVVIVNDAHSSYAESLEPRLEPVWRAIRSSVDEAEIRRIGLRYINHIPAIGASKDLLDWKDIVSDSVAAVLGVPDPNAALARAVGVAEYSFGDYSLRFQFGMHNPDYPAPFAQKLFLLDYDCYAEAVVEDDDVFRLLSDFEKAISSMFELSIGGVLRSEMHAHG